jgi:hydrogenase maturation protease
MKLSTVRCLILACGNTLRGDDGVGPWLAQWAEDRFSGSTHLRILTRQQWTPELTEDIAQAESVLFIDCAVNTAPGSVHLEDIAAAAISVQPSGHHMDATQLLALTRELYNALPHIAIQLTVGAGSTEMGEQFSYAVEAALPRACSQMEETIQQLLGN